MPDAVIRSGVLVAVIVLLWLLVRAVRLFVERQRRAVLALSPVKGTQESLQGNVRILAFSTPDCRQCQTMQTPALERIKQVYGAMIQIVKIDAVQQAELAQQYRVMTVPSTIVLDKSGQVQAVNYGFAPTQQLKEQIEKLLV